MSINLEYICTQTCQLSHVVGAFLREELGKVAQTEIEHKQRNHLVSYVDKNAERQLIKGLQTLLPEASFLAEEGTVVPEKRPWQWIIDPLDGTTNFLHGLPFFSISLALQHEGKTVLGVVHEANRQETFYSWKGASGSFLNKKVIQVSPTATLEDSLLATGFPYYDFEKMQAYINILQSFIRDTRGLRRFGSAALDLAYVACGRFDGYFEYSLSPWDVAGGAFLVQQAGGCVSDFSGGDNFIHGREIVAGNSILFDTLLERVHSHF